MQFEVTANEEIGNLGECGLFDGALSNFSGLNCVEDLAAVARQLASLVKPGGRTGPVSFHPVLPVGDALVSRLAATWRERYGAGREARWARSVKVPFECSIPH